MKMLTMAKKAVCWETMRGYFKKLMLPLNEDYAKCRGNQLSRAQAASCTRHANVNILYGIIKLLLKELNQ